MISVASHQLVPIMFGWNGNSRSMYYSEIAEAVARAAISDPIFPGPAGSAATACLLLSEAFEASRFTPYLIQRSRYGVLQIPMPREPKKSSTELLLSKQNALFGADLFRESFLRTPSLPWYGRLAWFLDLGTTPGGSDYSHTDYKGTPRVVERSYRTVRRAKELFVRLYDKKAEVSLETLAPKLNPKAAADERNP